MFRLLLPVVALISLGISAQTDTFVESFSFATTYTGPSLLSASSSCSSRSTKSGMAGPLFSSYDDDDDDVGFDEETTRNPTAEIARLKAEMKQAQEDKDMDKVMTLMGTLLALGGGYDNEAGPPGGSSEGKCAD